MKKNTKLFAYMAILACWGALHSCCRDRMDSSNLPDFVKSHFVDAPTTLSEEVDLYVDYSTCVACASESPFYNATHPAIVDCDPNFYSIKGPVIKFETNDRNEAYRLLRTIREVNNADLQATATQIVKSDHQAVLITDGEYFPDNVVRDNLNNPYLAPSFKKWLSASHDIYIYSEPYVESGRYDKFRYYIIFTDDDMPNNVNDRFYKNAPEASDVLVLHMSADAPKLSADSIVFNEAFPPYQLAKNIYDLGMKLDDVYSYTSDGNQTFILRGPKVKLRKEDAYQVKSVKPVVYLLNAPYQQFCDSLTVSGKRIHAAISNLPVINNLFQLDKGSFENNGELVLEFDKSYYPGAVFSDKGPWAFKIDFVVDEAADHFSRNEDINRGFQWNSISAAQNHALNTSFYQSVSLTLKDPGVDPGIKQEVISTIYLFFPR